MPDLTNDQLTIALAVVAGVALVGLLVAFVLALRLGRLRRTYAILRSETGERDILAVVGRSLRRVDALSRRIDDVEETQRANAALDRFALQKFHLVRYDAFDDMGGRLSFSAALLDDHGDGLIITSINGRTETRTYAKPIRKLTSEHNLSEEERRAIAGALSKSERGRVAAPSSR